MQLRDLLPEIIATLTQHPRHEVLVGRDFEWSKASWTHNVFRSWELIAGRRAGIRCEVSATVDKDGRQITSFGTWESVIGFSEGVVRGFFKGLVPKFEIVPTPVLLTPDGTKIPLSPFRFAIAYVTSGTDGGQAIGSNISLTVSGANTYIFGMPVGVSGASGLDPLQPSSYNSVTMSSTASSNIKGSGTSAIWIRGDYLAAPTSGTHNYTTVQTGGQFMYGSAASVYSGASQGAPDTSGVSNFTNPNASATITVTLNTATASCWMCMFGFTESGTLSASTNATLRTAGSPIVVDSNGNIATGSFAMSVTGAATGSNATGGYGFKFAEVVSGPANVKSFDGVTQSTGIKTYFGLAVASTKTVDGIN